MVGLIAVTTFAQGVARRIKRKLRWHYIDARARLGLDDVAILAQGWRPAYGEAQIQPMAWPRGAECFSVHDALHGSRYDAQMLPEDVYAAIVQGSKGLECLRYYAAGLDDAEAVFSPEPGVSTGAKSNVAMVYFSGDIILRTARGVRRLSKAYLGASPDSVTAEMRLWAEEAGVPAIFLARPGIYGSSGEHERRRQPEEIDLINKALDQIASRYGIERFILVGQSGGGLVAVSLLNKRADIQAAISASGLLSVKRTMRFWRRSRPVPGGKAFPLSDFYEPLDEIAGMARDPAPEIYILSDPRDTVIPFGLQLGYMRGLRAAGAQLHRIYAHAAGDKLHNLAAHGRLAAVVLARGGDVADVRHALVALDMANLGEKES